MDKFFAMAWSRDFLCLAVPFVLWIYCFHHFFTGKLWLQADATSYADHISFYTDNLSKGVFPLWDPAWFSGAPYHFFLRRIGDVNPLLFLIVLLKWFGVGSATSYLLFLALYYFLAGWAFYLITRMLLIDRFFAFTAYILFLFSSWGSEIFYNYIIIIFVPIIWFFYFLLSFSKEARKGYFLGMCFCVGIILTTYIPFFFLIILIIFTAFFILFYGKTFIDFLKRGFTFFGKNKVFVCFCVFFLLVSSVPALIFYKESKSGEFVLPGRHSGSDTASEVAVGISNVASGDIISHGYFDRIFEDHAHLDLGDIYIPFVFFLILLTTACARSNKLIFFLLFNVLGLSLITITSAAGVHRFLYDHIIFFKFIRNIYYFFWLAMLPMAILLSVTALKSLLSAINSSSKKMAWFVYIAFCHVLFILFLCKQQGILSGAWVVIVISLIYFWVYLRYENKISYPAGFCLFLLAVFIQSCQVYGFVDSKLFRIQRDIIHNRETGTFSSTDKLELYYASHWFSILVNYIDPVVLEKYRNRKFIFYDNVIPYADNQEFFKTLQDAMAKNANVAYVSKYDTDQGDWRMDRDAGAQADIDPVLSGKLTVISSDANTWKLKTHLADSQFLLINDNYNVDWHAFINGHQAHLLRANVSFKGLWIPSGESDIVLRFSTPRRYLFHYALIAFFMFTFLYFIVLLRKDRK